MPTIACDAKDRPVGIYLNMPEDFYKKSHLPEQKFFNKTSISQTELISLVKHKISGN